MGESERKWQAFGTRAAAKGKMARLKGFTTYRALSYGLGCVIEEHGRP